MQPGLSPIALFVFNRPDHTQRTLEALKENSLADKSDLFIYADGARSQEDISNVNQVRNVVNSAKGFRSVTIIERDTNYGLAHNIIEGVSTVCRAYGKVIVLEDDIVTSPYFLTFMNNALDIYASNPKVWHVSGWNYPISPNGMEDSFFWRVMNCWGWGTWIDRWHKFKKNPEKLIETWESKEIRRFNLDGSHNFWGQVTANQSGQLNTWAIFWYATIFENGGLCLNPTRSLVLNIGHDGSGQNCGESSLFSGTLLGNAVPALPNKVSESALAVKRIRNFYRQSQGSLLRRYAAKLKNHIRQSVGSK